MFNEYSDTDVISEYWRVWEHIDELENGAGDDYSRSEIESLYAYLDELKAEAGNRDISLVYSD